MHGEAIGIGRTPVAALSYLLVASWLLACARYAVTAPKPVEAHELHGTVPAK
jgi:AGZA family xanthine/uracil permease-like MFS transporter